MEEMIVTLIRQAAVQDMRLAATETQIAALVQRIALQDEAIRLQVNGNMTTRPA